MPTDLPPRDEQTFGAPSAVPPPIPVAPPTRPGELAMPQRRVIWPTPVGIVMIVLSAWTLLSAFGSVMVGVGGFFMASVPVGSEEEEMMQAFSDFGPSMIAAGIMLAIAAGLGIGGGIGLIMRRRWAVLVLFIFAGWKIIASAINAIAYASMMSGMMEASMQAAGQTPAGMPGPGMMSGMGTMMGAMKFVTGVLLPAFILIWLCLPNIKKDYRGW